MPTYDVPSWVKPDGLLPRVTHFGGLKGIPIFRDAEDLPIIPRSEWQGILDTAGAPECSSLIWNVYNQSSVGSCAAEGCYKMGETVREKCGRVRHQFNPYAMYHFTSGGRDNGSSLDANIQFAFTRGCVREALWPRSKGWKAVPSDEALEDAERFRYAECFDIDIDSQSQYELEIGTCLLYGIGVYAGYSGHAIYLTRMISPTEVEYINSWDYDWGNNGFGTIKYSKLYRGYGAFAVRAVLDDGERIVVPQYTHAT